MSPEQFNTPRIRSYPLEVDSFKANLPIGRAWKPMIDREFGIVGDHVQVEF